MFVDKLNKFHDSLKDWDHFVITKYYLTNYEEKFLEIYLIWSIRIIIIQEISILKQK